MPPARNVDGGVEYRNQQGVVRLTVAGPGTVRVRFSPGKELGGGDSYAVLPAAAQPPRAAFQFSSQGAVDRLRTDLLTIEIGRSPFRLRFLDAAGHLLDRDT